MEVSVTDKNTRDVLRDVKTRNPVEGWSGEYLQIDGNHKFKHRNAKFTNILLRPSITSEIAAFDAGLIHGIKFDKYRIPGDLYDEVKVVSTPSNRLPRSIKCRKTNLKSSLWSMIRIRFF